MKKLILAIFAALLVSCITTKESDNFSKENISQNLVVKTDTTQIVLQFNGQDYSWEIRGKQSLSYTGEVNTVVLLTPQDSLSFSISPGESVPVDFILKGKDTVTTIFTGITKPVHFDQDYIADSKGKYEVFIPKVHELLHIALTLTDYSVEKPNLLSKPEPYYGKVQSAFKSLRKHALIDSLDRNLKKYGYKYYYNLKMNACMYTIEDGGKIINSSPYKRMGGGGNNYMEELLPILEDFGAKSAFENFHNSNLNYYSEIVESYYKLVPIDAMWQWLEERSEIRHGSYKIYISPLVGEAHSTKRFEDNGFSESLMFVSAPIFPENYSQSLKVMEASLRVFTEIDHNYVNPISDNLYGEIENSFGNRFFWVLDDPGVESYATPYAVFNEYMTWSLFSLYCLDNFDRSEAESYIATMENQMVKKRGFVKFREFNQELIRIYDDSEDLGIEELSKKILQWAKVQQSS